MHRTSASKQRQHDDATTWCRHWWCSKGGQAALLIVGIGLGKNNFYKKVYYHCEGAQRVYQLSGGIITMLHTNRAVLLLCGAVWRSIGVWGPCGVPFRHYYYVGHYFCLGHNLGLYNCQGHYLLALFLIFIFLGHYLSDSIILESPSVLY